ncbi:type IV pilus modification protein PilV [Agaribacter flavus]|uniref:Type IV pilus modification protein PilV n=1 Tax=Agaribacter flavus TaxID=1902781 RepID=A0ABV7FSB4_9ALTE
MRSLSHNYVVKINSKQTGISMLEVLITLFILSVGLLGVASMQFIGAFSNKEAMSRTQAVMVSQQMTERLRASIQPSQITDGFVVDNAYFDANNYNFNNLSCSANLDDFACYCEVIPPSIPDCLSGDCTAQEFAVFDAYKMSCATEAANPAAELAVTCNDSNPADADSCTAGSLHKIMVKWPAPSWQNLDRVANQNCNAPGANDYDCVVIEVAL